MKEHPFPFTATMALAVHEDRKWQTRRLISPSNSYFNGSPWAAWTKEQTWDWENAFVDAGPSPAGNSGPYLKLPWKDGDDDFKETVHRIYPRWEVGDRLWVREPWYAGKCADGLKPSELFPAFWLRDNGGLWYQAGDAEPEHPVTPKGRYRHARFMPRWASRITLEITDIRVERLQDIDQNDAAAEGIWPHNFNPPCSQETAVRHFRELWESINGPGSWEANPWVWVIEFKRVEP